MIKSDLKSYIRDVPNFPKPGIIFKDISPLLMNPEAYNLAVDLLASVLDPETDVIIAPEARGFLFGPQVAIKKTLPFVMIRKQNKLPGTKAKVEYELEYGVSTFEIITNLVKPGMKVTIIDDILATGGSANGMIKLIHTQGAKVISAIFLAELKFLNGANNIKLPNDKVISILSY